MCSPLPPNVISGWGIRMQIEADWGRLRHKEAGQKWPPAITSYRGGEIFVGDDVLVLLDSSTHKKNLTSRGTPENASESSGFLWNRDVFRGKKLKVLGSNFFLDGSTHLISLDDFPAKKSGVRSRKTEKFPHKIKFLKKNDGFFKNSLWFLINILHTDFIWDFLHTDFSKSSFSLFFDGFFSEFTILMYLFFVVGRE